MTMRPRIGFTFALLFLLVSGYAVAAPPSLAATTVSQATTTGHVTVIVLDMSGSMAQNDPAGLRCSAANAYIDLSGPGNFVGVVGLDNNDNATGGPHNFDLAQKWADPTELATDAARSGLRATIKDKSHDCKPDANTPTYDALNKASDMLAASTQGGKLSGSVILLTDGDPQPNSSDQTSAIQSDLAPKFKTHGWQVDTIALGSSSSFHGFLSDLSNATAGKFYDDSKGPVAGVSPLNLEHFFVDIFQLRNGRTPGATIPPTALSGGTVQRNFAVGNFDSHLDVITVKDQPNTTVTVTAPNGQTIPPDVAGTFVAQDPHYTIFAIDNPESGNWQLNVSGGGQFLMDSLVVSRLSLSIDSPTKGHAEPLGQPVTISASLRDGGNAIVGGQFALKAMVAFAGNTGGSSREVLLSDPNNSGNYTGTLTIATSEPTGSYEITVAAQAASETAVQAQTTAQFARFPTAVLISPITQQPTTDLITAQVVNWDPALRFLYGKVPLYNATIPPFISSLLGWHPSDWPLNGKAADPTALISGEVLIGTNLYTNATVTGTATQDGTKAVLAVDVKNDGNGKFRVYFPAGAKGSYHVTLTSRGAFKDVFGELVTTSAPIAVTVGQPSLQDELRAWAITLLYTLVLALITLFGIYGPINYLVRAKPHRSARLVDVARNLRANSRSQLDPGMPLIWRSWSLRRYFAPNVLPASEVSLPSNLRFIFRRGNEVAVKVAKPSRKDPGAQWSIDGKQVTAADATSTIVANTRLAYSEGSYKTEFKFEQDIRGGGADLSMGGGGGGVRDRLEEAAGNVGMRDRLRRGRGLRND